MSESSSENLQRRQFVGRAASVVGASSLLGAGAISAEEAPSPLQQYCGKPQRSMIEAQVIAKAWEDPRYLAQLKRNPQAVLSRELGTEIPRNVNIRVVEEQPNQIYLVVPVNPNQFSEKRLSNRELQAVAAGIRFDTPCDTVASMMPAWFQQLEFFPRSRDLRR